MGRTPTISIDAPSEAETQQGRQSIWATIRLAALGTRSRRILSLLVLLWILNAFDLTYTILAHRIGGFFELNPFARMLLGTVWGLVLFKLILVGGGSIILLRLRRHRLTELVCWGLCLIYTALAFTWMAYYGVLTG